MSNEKLNTDDLHDRLIDGALREVVGQETPPDLSEQILFAATGEHATKLSTSASGDEAMTTQHRQAIKKRNLWIGLTLAASLLLATGLILPTFQSTRESARTVKPEGSSVPQNVNVPSLQTPQPPSAAENDFEDLTDLIQSTVEHWGWDKNEAETQPFPLNLSLFISQSQRLHSTESPAQAEGQGQASTQTPSSGEGEPLKVKVYPIADLVLPVQENFAWGLKQPENKSASVREEFSTKPGTEIARQLREKIERYQVLAANLGGAESPVATTVLNMQINEARQVQAALIQAKDNLVELEVQKSVAMQNANSPSALETVVAKELGSDPIIANQKTEELAIAQRIRAIKSQSARGTSTELKRLEQSLQRLAKESAKYRAEREVELRKEIRRAPGDYLAQELVETILKRNITQERIAKLEKAYRVKVAEINRKGDRSAELSLLESEIELLQQLEQGRGPDVSGDQYTRIYENPFVVAEGEKAVSTFSIDVDTASYANVRQFLMQSGQLPPPDAVRIEELVNYFDYDYSAPTGDTPFASHVEVAGCPWKADHRLVRVGIKGREIATDRRPPSNLVFLIDVSGSMDEPAKLPLLVEGMKLLTRELGENDRVAIVVYASSEGLALPSTRGDKQDTILAALEQLRAGGSTAGGAGIELAYKIARENFIKGGVNRVILATDGDFNVGTTSTGDLTRLAEANAKETGVFLTVLGFGRGNLNDAMMEAISGKGNGNYHYVDNRTEAQKVLVAEMAGTLVTIAKDVKIQIEFNPAQVAGYRLIGYENRMLATEDFNDDKKDAGEIGAGHTVTAIYEVVPAGKTVGATATDPLKYQQPAKTAKPTSDADASDELLTLKIRYKQPDGEKSTKLVFPITDNGQSFAEATDDFKFASAVASFGMLLRHSEHQGSISYSAVEEIAQDGSSKDKHGYRAEFLRLVRQAKQLAGE